MWMDRVEEDLKRMKIVGWRAKVEDRQEWNRIVEQTETHPGLWSQQKKRKMKKKKKYLLSALLSVDTQFAGLQYRRVIYAEKQFDERIPIITFKSVIY